MSKQYLGADQREISFPLGGIGSGCVGLAGNGALVDFELFGKPNKRTRNGFSHFAVRAEDKTGVIDARVLHGDLHTGYTGEYVRGGVPHSGYGFGPEPASMAGFPHFAHCAFTGAFPIARLDFADAHFPGKVRMTAFNPFIPHNDRDSSMPAAFFAIELENTGENTLDYTVALNLRNPVGAGRHAHTLVQEPGFCGIHLTHANPAAQPERQRGGCCIATDADSLSYQQYWYRGAWCDEREMYLRDLARPGGFVNRVYAPGEGEPCQDTALLAAHARIPAGEKRTLRFVLSWYYPLMSNDWNPEKDDAGQPVYRYWKHYYASLFDDAVGVARAALRGFDALLAQTETFTRALYASSLPPAALEAVGANLAVLKSPVCYRLERGEFYAFEGALMAEGSCEGSCTHVWNYAYALPFLFPKLERGMRDLEYAYCQGDAGDVSFRLMLPLGRARMDFRPCVDGQMGGVIKCWRDYKISGDVAWLRAKWPSLQKALAYAWSPDNPDRWDPDKRGLITGRQHHTLDMELFGANSWLSGFYLAALKAGAEIARVLGDAQAQAEYAALYEQGKARLNAELFDGAYFAQRLDVRDARVLAPFPDAAASYWNAETGEIKYQIVGGCGIDQMVAQWHAHLCGLGDIFDPDKARVALKSLYQHNFRAMREVANTWRLFALQEESGLLMCTWPAQDQPSVPLTYASECMTGFEYAAACHMIQAGLMDEGMRVVDAVRDRYDGNKRNPFSEIECGSNYARSMASYSLLLAYSGFRYDAAQGHMGFFPPDGQGVFFWSMAEAWGTVDIAAHTVTLDVLYGQIWLDSFACGAFAGRQVSREGVAARKLADDTLALGETCAAGQRVVWRMEG